MAVVAILATGVAHAYKAPMITTADMEFLYSDTHAIVRGRGAPEVFFYPNIRSVSVAGRELSILARGPHWLQVKLPEGELDVTVAGDTESPMLGPVCVSPPWKPAGVLVSTADELAAAAKAAKPGDTIVVKNGHYDAWIAALESTGEAEKPVTIRPETPGGVVFRLRSRLVLRGNHTVFREFRFDQTSQNVLSIIRGDDNRINQCHFYSCGNETSTFGHITNLREKAERNRVEFCYWTRSKCMSLGISTPGKKPEQAVATDNTFFNNVFRDVERYWINGQENIQLCSGGPMSEAAHPRTTIEANLFDWAWGDGEIISNKSSENCIRYNVFAHCPRSALVLRGGDDVIVEGNVMVDTEYGVRMFGRGHRVVNNLIVGSRGAAFYVRPHQGGTMTADCLIAHNTVVDCGAGFSAGTGKFHEGEPRAPSRVVNNIFSTRRGILIRPDLRDELDVQNNILHVAGAAEIGYEGRFAIKADPNMTGEGIALKPGKGSVAIDHAKDIGIKQDRWGTKRPQGAASDIGADEVTNHPTTRRMPDVPAAREWSLEWFKGDPKMQWDAARPMVGWTDAKGATAKDGEIDIENGSMRRPEKMPENFVMEWQYNPVAFASKASVTFRAGDGDAGYRLTFGGAQKDGKPVGFFTLEKNGQLVARCTDTVFFRPNYIPYYPNRMVAIDREAPNPEAWYHARLLVADNRVRLILNRSGRKAEGDPGNMGDVTVLLWEDTADIAGPVLTGRGLRIDQEGAGRWRDFYVWQYGDVRKETPGAPKSVHAQADGTRVRLTWKPAEAGRAGRFYEVQRDGKTVAARVGETTWDDLEARPETTHRYRLRARTQWGRDSQWAEATAKTGARKHAYLILDASDHVAIESPMRIATDEETERRYVGAALGTGRFMDAPPPKGYADYEFHVPKDGVYSLWGNVIAPSKSHDSFYITLPGADKAKPYYTGTSSAWTWTRAASGLKLQTGKFRLRLHPPRRRHQTEPSPPDRRHGVEAVDRLRRRPRKTTILRQETRDGAMPCRSGRNHMAENDSGKQVLAIFGGAFDPPHVGHVLAVHYVLLTSPARRVFVVPCGDRHPFGKRLEPFADRQAMCRLAFEHLGESVEVLDIEGRREGPSYTVDTVRELQALHPNAHIELVVGSDTLEDLDAWHEIDALREMAAFRVLPRLEDRRLPDGVDEEVLFCLPRVSSTTVRELLETNADAHSRVPACVLDYIREHNLYR